ARGGELRRLLAGHERREKGVDIAGGEELVALGDEVAADARHRRIADAEVEVGAAALEELVEQGGDPGHSRSFRLNRPRLAGSGAAGWSARGGSFLFSTLRTAASPA